MRSFITRMNYFQQKASREPIPLSRLASLQRCVLFLIDCDKYARCSQAYSTQEAVALFSDHELR
jgi:hypothetical protein